VLRYYDVTDNAEGQGMKGRPQLRGGSPEGKGWEKINRSIVY